tara:strand:- start:682 stop:1053 length:372 start_codon:yes stop_codon:yes gene_type:complete
MNQITTPANYTSTMKALQNTEAIMAAAILPAGGYRSEGREAAAKDWRAVAIEVRKHARAYPKFYYYVALDPVDMSDDQLNAEIESAASARRYSRGEGISTKEVRRQRDSKNERRNRVRRAAAA